MAVYLEPAPEKIEKKADERCRDATGVLCRQCYGGIRTGMNGCWGFHPIPGELLDVQSHNKTSKEIYGDIRGNL